MTQHELDSKALEAALPCPFCGKEPRLRYYDWPHKPAYMNCDDCGVVLAAGDGTPAEVIATWNRRAALPPPADELRAPIKLEIAKPPPWSYRGNDAFRWLPVALAGMTGVSDWIVKLPSGREHFIAQEDYEALSPMQPAADELQADKARLDWLEMQAVRVVLDGEHFTEFEAQSFDDGPSDLRAQIDRARAGEADKG